MTHVRIDLMQRFLADEADLMERDAIAEHLTQCDECAALLSQLAADDDSLAEALRLDPAEAEWVASMDLTGHVMARISPWYTKPSYYLPLLLAGAPAALLFSMVTSFLGQLVRGTEPMDAFMSALRALIPALWRLNLYLARGGLLKAIWPALLLAALITIWHYSRKKEAPDHA